MILLNKKKPRQALPSHSDTRYVSPRNKSLKRTTHTHTTLPLLLPLHNAISIATIWLHYFPIHRLNAIFPHPLNRLLLLLPARNPHLHTLSLLLLHLALSLLIITPNIRNQIHKHNIISDPQYKEEPEEIDTLQASEQGESDVLADPAFVLLGVPIEVEGADGAEGGEGGVEDDEVDVVAEVDPDADEESEEGEDEGGVEVV